MYIAISLDSDGYRARLFGANHQLVWWTEGYVQRADAEHAVSLMRTYAAGAPLYYR